MGIILLLIVAKQPLESYFDFYKVIVCMFISYSVRVEAETAM